MLNILKKLNSELLDKYMYLDSIVSKIYICGSFAECCKYKMVVEPNDIDLVFVIKTDIEKPDNETIYLTSTGNTPVNIEYITSDEYYSDFRTEAKYLSSFKVSNYPSKYQVITRRNIRSIVSKASNKAFDKGRKKLVIVKDYDPELGLKNIFHAFKFVYIAKWEFLYHYYNSTKTRLLNIDLDVNELLIIENNIKNIYYSTEGTLDERSRAVLEYAKPLHNKLMSEFRILFPKE